MKVVRKVCTTGLVLCVAGVMMAMSTGTNIAAALGDAALAAAGTANHDTASLNPTGTTAVGYKPKSEPVRTTTTVKKSEPTTTTVKKSEPTTTTIKRSEPTTTTVPAPVGPPQALSISCSTTLTGTAPSATCTWTKSTAATFNHYTIIRWVGNVDPSLVIASIASRDTTTTTDKTVAVGKSYGFMVVAYDAAGRVVGYSQRTDLISCCSVRK